MDTGNNNSMALTSVISGGVAWVIGGLGSCALAIFFAPLSLCTGIVFFVGSIVAIVTGHMGRKQIKEGGKLEEGDSLALAGIIMGYAGIAVNVLMICLIVVGIFGLAAMGPEIGDVFSDIIRDLELTPQP
ncbi:MAG: DUF4190 domain-containing protein [Chloroflexi bacterium]|nr:DUF4190 domain-containing protein [Chloroflexota bacterium]